MKGILIVMVVLGHTTIKLPLIDVFWFHMPAFFMITGYLSQRWVSFGDKMYLRRKTCQLLIPYLSYSVLLFLLIGYSPLWKYILKVLLGGTLNITPFSYPFWYINTLFVALVAWGLIKQLGSVIQLLLIASLYIIIHLMSCWDFHPPVPLGIDNAMGALVFIYIGDRFKVYKPKKWHYFLVGLPVLFAFVNKWGEINYQINMASMIYDNLLLDLMVPCMFAFVIYLLCLQLNKWKFSSTILSMLGRSSMTIYFTHAAIIFLLRPYVEQSFIVVCCIFIGVILHFLFLRFGYTRLLFLGIKRNE